MRTTLIRTTAASAALAAALSATALASADAAPHHGTHARAGAYQVTATVNRVEPELGDKVKIRGSVSPAAAGAEVKLQVKYEGRKSWKTIDTTKLSGASRYTFKDKVGSVRFRKYRVVKPAGHGHAAGSATTLKVTVYGWRTLDSLTPVSAQSFYENGTATINAKAYPNSLRALPAPAAQGQISYNINRSCKQLDAVYGIDDSSPLNATGTIALTADGTLKHAGTYGLTQAQRVVTDVTGVFRISLTGSQTGGAIPAVGTPRVLCSF